MSAAPVTEAQRAVESAARVDELAGLRQLEAPRAAEARAAPLVDPGDVRLCMSLPSQRERGRGEAGADREDDEVPGQQPARHRARLSWLPWPNHRVRSPHR